MLVIGIVGGIASGKSFVSQQLCELGAECLDADRAGHEVLAREHVRTTLRNRWGNQIVNTDGEVDRRRVAEIVFAPPPDGPRELAYLESITHPLIGEILREQIEALRRRGDCPAVVLDAPLLLKAEWDAVCDLLLFVAASRDVRLARARQRGWTEQQFAAREAAQLPLNLKQARADVVIDNDGDPNETRRQIAQFWANCIPPAA